MALRDPWVYVFVGPDVQLVLYVPVIPASLGSLGKFGSLLCPEALEAPGSLRP